MKVVHTWDKGKAKKTKNSPNRSHVGSMRLSQMCAVGRPWFVRLFIIIISFLDDQKRRASTCGRLLVRYIHLACHTCSLVGCNIHQENEVWGGVKISLSDVNSRTSWQTHTHTHTYIHTENTQSFSFTHTHRIPVPVGSFESGTWNYDFLHNF